MFDAAAVAQPESRIDELKAMAEGLAQRDAASRPHRDGVGTGA